MWIDWVRRVLGGRGFPREREEDRIMWNMYVVLLEMRDLLEKLNEGESEELEEVYVDWDRFGEVLLRLDIGGFGLVGEEEREPEGLVV